MSDITRCTLRLPQDAAEFINQKSKKNLTSQNAEIVRSIRERMDREGEARKEKSGTTA